MEGRESRQRRHEGDGGATALLVVDMLNPYEHPEADRLAERVEDALPGVLTLLRRARESETQIVYVNDNYGDWSADRTELARRALDGPNPDLVEPVLPPDSASFVTKARHTIFYETPLDYLLRSQGIQRVALVGQVTEQCILYSALDAYVRHYEVVVARDAVAHIDSDLAEAALQMMRRNMRAGVVTADTLFAPASRED
jgi:nicotinamidase-related amidase